MKPSVIARGTRRLAVPCVLAFGIGARGQAPVTPVPPLPAGHPPVAAPTPGTSPNPAEPQAEGPRRPQGKEGRQGKDKDRLELPEFTPVAAPTLAALAERPQFFWFTMYPDFVVQFDPATDTVVKKVHLEHGLFWSSTLTQDRKRLLVVTDQQQGIEVVDLTTGAVTGSHPIKEEGFVLRIRDVRECPGGVCWLVRTERIKQEIDRYSFEPSEWVLYDSAQKKVLRKIKKLPEALDRGASLSADGSMWQSQDKDGNLVFLDGRTFEEKGRIELATPRFFGAGAIRLGFTDLLDRRDPDRALMMFTSTDPVEKRRTCWGVVDLDLKNRRVVDVQEWGPNVSAWGLRIAAKQRLGAAMVDGRDDEHSRLVTYDLHDGKKLAEVEYEFRPRRGLVAISPNGDKLYVGIAGSDLEVFDQKLQRLKTVEFEGEISGRIYVVDG